LYAASHLNVLSLCSYGSGTARKLFTTFQIVFNDIREVLFSPVYHGMRELHNMVGHIALVPPSYYEAVEPAREMIKHISGLALRVTHVLEESLNT
jgi:hypothetical protein